MLLWIFLVLLVLIVWASYLTLTLTGLLALPIWAPVVASVLVLLGGYLSIRIRRWRERRDASRLEAAIVQQGAQQALNANPTRRAEIQELQTQVAQGIKALKTSKLGKGKSGAAALYSLPWYMIIGPPGAGKTTAIKHSGLMFPFEAAGGGAVRGVGGTRNCDWWFTNEGILLDTAGRYTTESDDRDEWFGFLDLLIKYRSRHPINGIIVAIGVNELLDASEQQIESNGKRIRARIDEVMTRLKMVVPVYLLLTKVDLIAGFSETFGDLRKSERSQTWGTTLRLDRDKSKPAEVFEQEFDELVKRIHGRSLKRLVAERSREARERIYQFPVEFGSLRRNLSDLVSHVFQVNAFQGTPLFRGFYFTSGTQEGRPLDRVLQRMSQAMGIRAVDPGPQQQPAVESKSYFLHDMFMNVVFPDGALAVRAQAEVTRQRIMRLAIAGSAFALGAVLALPSLIGYANNKQLLSDTVARSKQAAEINWTAVGPADGKLDALTPLYRRLEEFEKWDESGTPIKYQKWLMYQGEAIRSPALSVFVKQMQDGFVVPTRTRLEEQLRAATGTKYMRERTQLKAYLMLSDVEHLDVEWATERYVSLWSSLLRGTTSTPPFKLRERIEPLVKYYFQLLADGKIKPVPTNADLIAKVRKVLQDVPVSKRYYAQFVDYLSDELYDDTRPDDRENRVFPSDTLVDLFPEPTRKVLGSKRHRTEKKWREVEGPYTAKGHSAVTLRLDKAAEFLESEAWVVPLTREETADKIPGYLLAVVKDYEQMYISQWTDFLKDVEVLDIPTLKEAVNAYDVLRTPETPYLLLLRRLHDATQWDGKKQVLENKEVTRVLSRKLNDKASAMTGGLQFNFKVSDATNRAKLVPTTFRKTLEFGINLDGSQRVTPFETYLDSLGKLRTDMRELMRNQGDAVNPREIQDKLLAGAKQVEEMLMPLDDKAREILYPWLARPFAIGGIVLPPPTYNRAQPAKPPGK